MIIQGGIPVELIEYFDKEYDDDDDDTFISTRPSTDTERDRLSGFLSYASRFFLWKL